MINATPIFDMLGGRDRSTIAMRANKSTFSTMHDLRQSRTSRGTIEQTPRFYVFNTEATRTYYDGGTQSEPASSAIRGITPAGTVSDYVIDSNGSQLKVFYQTTQPNGETVYTGCLLTIANIAGLGINLGSTLEVEMTGAATFRWRKNGGGYTAGLVPSISGTSIDGGNAVLYFLANTGFAGTETWAWTRTDCSFDNAATVVTKPTEWVQDNSTTWLTNRNERIMRTNRASDATCIISAGYRAIYGSYLRIFSDHLVVQDASTTATAQGNRTHVIKSSDKTDLNNFIATDVNEADTYLLPLTKTGVDETIQGVGLLVLGEYLYAFTGSEIFYTPDLGLPIVFDFNKLGLDQHSNLETGAQTLVEARDGAYVLANSGITFFNGQALIPVGQAVRDIPSSNWTPFGIYDSTHNELIFFDGNQTAGSPKLYVFQTEYGTWHSRSATFETVTPYGPTSFAVTASGILQIGKRSKTVLQEDVFAFNVPVADLFGTGWGVPTLITQNVGNFLNKVIEIEGTYVGCTGNGPTLNPGSNYVTGANIRFVLSWWTSNTGYLGTTLASNALAYTDDTKPDGFISYPRISCRSIAFQITLVDPLGVKPPMDGIITAIEPMLSQGTASR